MLTKRDLLAADDPLPALLAPEAAAMLAVSSAAGSGLEELKEYLWKFVETGQGSRRSDRPSEVSHDVSGYWEFMDDE